jgi:hypothetical protein
MKSKLTGNQLGSSIHRAGIISDDAASFLNSKCLVSQEFCLGRAEQETPKYSISTSFRRARNVWSDRKIPEKEESLILRCKGICIVEFISPGKRASHAYGLT